MSSIRLTFLVLAASSTIFATHAVAQEPKADVKLASKLVATWQLVSSKRDGKEGKLPPGATVVKHVTPTHFMTAMYDDEGKVRVGTGGSYIVKGDEIEETAEYSSGRPPTQNESKVATFKCRVEKNRWHLVGQVNSDGNNVTIEQVWERLERK